MEIPTRQDWHLKSLRTAGQHGILLRFYKNELAAQKQAYEDVLDQYGAQCEQNTELEEKMDFLTKEKQELLSEVASLKGPKESSNDDAFKELETLRLQLEDAKKQILRLEEQKTSPASPVHNLEVESSTSDSLSASQPSKGKSKGKKGPGPPPAKAASEVAANPANETAESAEQTAPAADEENATPAPAPAKGKAKGKKGPGPPPAKAASEVAADPANETAESAEQTAPAADEENATPAPAPAKGKAKGKKGPGPPPAKAASEVAADPANENAESVEQTDQAALDGENATPAPAKAKGKGKKGPGPPPSKGGGGGEAAQVDQTNPETSTEAPAKGKAPPKGAAKGKGKGKSALPEIDPGPAPPKDMVGKKFHWTNVLGNRFAGSMFERIVQDLNASAKVSEEANDELERASKTLRVKLDVGVLTNFFFKRKDESETTAEVKESKKKTVAQCLSMQRSQNIEIFLNGCGINISHVKSAVLDLDEKAIDVPASDFGELVRGGES